MEYICWELEKDTRLIQVNYCGSVYKIKNEEEEEADVIFQVDICPTQPIYLFFSLSNKESSSISTINNQ